MVQVSQLYVFPSLINMHSLATKKNGARTAMSARIGRTNELAENALCGSGEVGRVTPVRAARLQPNGAHGVMRPTWRRSR